MAALGIFVVISQNNTDEGKLKFNKDWPILVVESLSQENQKNKNTFQSGDIRAPGENISVANAARPVDGNEGYVLSSGNSIASAFVTGVAAALWSKAKGFSPLRLKHEILKYSEKNFGNCDLSRSPKRFTPVWGAIENNVLDLLRPGQKYLKKLRCLDPLDGELSFEIVSGRLPKGLSMSNSGIIQGFVELDEHFNRQHLNYFSVIVRATNRAGSTDRNFTIVVTENFNHLRVNEQIVSPIRLAKCNGTDAIYGFNSPDNQVVTSTNDGSLNPPGDANMFITAMGDCCFAKNTLINMFDGSKKPIEKVQIGDKVLNEQHGFSEVMSIVAIPFQKHRCVFQINDLQIFVSDSHGLVGIDESIYMIKAEGAPLPIEAFELDAGVRLKTAHSEVEVRTLKKIKLQENSDYLFHLFVTNSGNYFVDGVLAYRKHEGEINDISYKGSIEI